MCYSMGTPLLSKKNERKEPLLFQKGPVLTKSVIDPLYIVYAVIDCPIEYITAI